MTLFTLGYEGLSLEVFISRLQSKGVQTVLDIREVPISRKKGFSKTAFREALEAHGINYVHLSALGCPKPVRDQYKLDKNWQTYTVGFEQYLATQKEVVLEVAGLAQQVNVCLVCFEADYNFCHRSIVAKDVAKYAPVQVAHITAKTVILERKQALAA